jgi:hypothetical protein
MLADDPTLRTTAILARYAALRGASQSSDGPEDSPANSKRATNRLGELYGESAVTGTESTIDAIPTSDENQSQGSDEVSIGRLVNMLV